jgi:hypothetical protein
MNDVILFYFLYSVYSTPVVVYGIERKDLLPLFKDDEFSRQIVASLNLEIRRQIRLAIELGRTPLLEQHAKSTSYIATSIAASIEIFYRSGFNAAINAALSGTTTVALGALLPNMHIQVMIVIYHQMIGKYD